LASFVIKLLLERHDGNAMFYSIVDTETLKLQGKICREISPIEVHLFWPNKVCIAHFGPIVFSLHKNQFLS